MFGNFVRVYLPPGVTDVWWQGNTGATALVQDENFTVVGGLVVVRPGDTGQFAVSYRTRDPVQSLEVWKQGGIGHDALRVLQNIDGSQSVLTEGPFEADVIVRPHPHSLHN